MPRLICTLENASEVINGIRFAADRGQMVSDEVPDDVAEAMATIPGYTILRPPAPPIKVQGARTNEVTNPAVPGPTEGGAVHAPEAPAVSPTDHEAPKAGDPPPAPPAAPQADDVLALDKRRNRAARAAKPVAEPAQAS